ncbi:thiolase family protein [Streptomyces sp. ISID311]|uniref:thiolase family protein n=1 Tax=Streptomyces sp. ISID311 TaxID=2601673 RepID=UPI0011BD35B5|nr:thiolase family protein [Streptomyces sp. ISID311]TXC99913.1 thiolase family protein [Streptomyces sp. ISID311]
MPGPVIAAAYEAQYERHPPASRTTHVVLREAVTGVMERAGLGPEDIDGLGVSSFSLHPDHVVDLAWKLGLTVRWMMQDPLGGASGVNMLQHAIRAVEAGDARCIVLVAGDALDRDALTGLNDNYNISTRDHLAPLQHGGPNALFAMLTTRHSRATGLQERDYAQIPLAQRRWAGTNPRAVYRSLMNIDDYLAGRMVSTPLRQFDCVPVVAGADALIVSTADRCDKGVRVTAIAAAHNIDDQGGDGLVTGLRSVRESFWGSAGFDPADVDIIGVYDDYPVMVLLQMDDLGLVPDGDLERFLHVDLAKRHRAVNTSGGQLSAGQAGAAGGMHLLVEAVEQLQGRRGAGQIPAARRAVVAGYGMVLYRFGSCANVVALEACRG